MWQQRQRAWGCGVVGAALIFTTGSPVAHAQLTAPAHRVVISPHFFLLDQPGMSALSAQNTENNESFDAQTGESDAASTSPQQEPDARRGARRYVAAHSELMALVPDVQVQRVVQGQPNYAQSLELARGLRDLGLQRYRELDLTQTIERLTQARQLYLRLRHDLIAPREVAEVHFFLALSYLERGAGASQALEHLREMILLDPQREALPGYYPENVVSAYRDARMALIRELERRGLPLELDAQARDLARLMGATDVLFGFVIPAERGGYMLRLFPWSAREERSELVEEMYLENLDPQRVEEGMDRLVARWADCLRLPVEAQRDAPITVRPGELNRALWSVDVNMSYATYLRFPRLRVAGGGTLGAVTYFGNYGLNIGVQRQVRRELAVVGRAQLLLSQRERSGLIDPQDVTMVRGWLGAELGVRFWRLRPALQVALEAGRLSEFSILGEVGCASKPRTGECADEVARELYDDYGFLFGVNVAPLLTLRLNTRAELLAMSSITYYLYSSSGGDEVNLPWSGELGVRYSF